LTVLQAISDRSCRDSAKALALMKASCYGNYCTRLFLRTYISRSRTALTRLRLAVHYSGVCVPWVDEIQILW